MLTAKLRYKLPDADESNLLVVPFADNGMRMEEANQDMHFVAAVASFGMLLRDSGHSGSAGFEEVLALAREGKDGSEYREEFLALVKRAQQSNYARR